MKQIAILDAGSRYSKLIDHCIRNSGIISEILPLNTSFDDLKCDGYSGIIIFGGPTKVMDNVVGFDEKIFIQSD